MVVEDHSVMEAIEDHHEEIGLKEMTHDQLLGLVDSSEWDDLVAAGYSEDIPYWHGQHIECVAFYDASREDLLEFHKWASYWRVMNIVNE